MENGSNHNKTETEKQRRLQHKVACNKLFSLTVSLLNFAKPTFALTVEQTLKFVMVCIVRYVMYNKIFGIDNDAHESQRDCIKTTFIAWSEDDIDIVDYGEEFHEPILPVGAKLSDVINIDKSGSLKNELRNVFRGLNPWGFNDFGPVECLVKTAQQKKKKGTNSEDVPHTRIILTGVLIRGILLDFKQVDKDSTSSEKAYKRALQPLNNNTSTSAKRYKTEALQSMETKPRCYTAWLSLATGKFIHFCRNFPVVTGIHDALGRFPTEFLHPDDIYWSQVAFHLWVMGNWNEPCTYRLKRQNPDGYIHIECEIQPATHESVHECVMNILSTVRETGGEGLIKDTQKRLKDQLLELLISSIKQAPQHRSDCHQLMPSNHLSNQADCHGNSSTYHQSFMTIAPISTCNETLHQNVVRQLSHSNNSPQTQEPVLNVTGTHSLEFYNNSQENLIAAVNQMVHQPQQYPDANRFCSHSSPTNSFFFSEMSSDQILLRVPVSDPSATENDDLFSFLALPESCYPSTSTPFANINPNVDSFDQNEANETSRSV